MGTGRGIKIAVLDSGIEISHPKLNRMRLLDDIAFQLSATGVIQRTYGRGVDVLGHGTAVAGILHRIAPEAQIGNYRILNNVYGVAQCKPAVVSEAALHACRRGYHILNCSIGIKATTNAIAYFKPWIDYAYCRGVHVVSACNNQKYWELEWPASFSSVITVNMANIESDELLFRWQKSNLDTPPHMVEFAARGVNIEVCYTDGRGEGKESGSSFAAPHVTGMLARLLSVYPGLKPPVAKALLQEVASRWTPEMKVTNG